MLSAKWSVQIAGMIFQTRSSEHTANEIEQKARKVMGMLKRGVKFTPTQPDVMAILKKTERTHGGKTGR